MKQFRLIAYEKIYFIEELRSYFNEHDTDISTLMSTFGGDIVP